MPIERAIVAQARPHVMAMRARELLQSESEKGCQGLVAHCPVALEPPYWAMGDLQAPPVPSDSPVLCVPEDPVQENELIRLGVWIDPNQVSDWNRSERFLKTLCSASHRIGLEVIGNRNQILVQMLCHRSDLPVLLTMFMAEFELCRLTQRGRHTAAYLADVRSGMEMYDFFPAPPYSHLLTQPDELRGTPYSAVTAALSFIEPPAIGIYQVLFQAVAPDHDWHANVQTLYNLEYAIKVVTGMPMPQKQAQQVPAGGGEIHDMAEAALTKAHNDKPFFAVSARIGVFGVRTPHDHIRALSAFSNLIQSGGRPLRHLELADYIAHMPADEVRRMFALGVTYRAGFLANSRELASFVHFPTAQILDRDHVPLRALETLPPSDTLRTGTPIGCCECAGDMRPVCIPHNMRSKHVHLIGRSGTGKSTLMEGMILDDIERGVGIAVLDPHGELVMRLLQLIPKKHMHRVIYIDPGDPKFTLLWNPLDLSGEHTVPGMDRGRVADDIVSAFKSVVTGWGDRLEHLLRTSIAAVMRLPGGSLRDVADLLRRKSVASQRLRQRILQVLDDPFERQFWLEDFDKYPQADINPPQHKLSKLLSSAPVRRMLSQPVSAFNLREVMDDGRVLLVNLSTVGSETREILGCFMLSLMHLSALGRSGSVGSHKPFSIFCDEAHRFLTDAMDDLIAETRKFSVGLVLAHQSLSQFGAQKVGAISNVGSTVIFDVDGRDAQYLLKDLLGKVEVEDLVGQEVGHAIARIGSQVVRFETHDRQELAVGGGCMAEILRLCRERYYRSVDTTAAEGQMDTPPQANDPASPHVEDGEFIYETFDRPPRKG